MEPPHHTFAKRHSISSKDRAETQKEQPENNVKATSNVNHLMLNGRSSLSLSSQRVFHSLTGREEPAREQLMHSVFLATGLFMDADEHIDEIPVRHKASTKSAFRWFIDVCMAGSGMFINAYVIITTGQVKTIWQHQYPTCWSPKQDQVCPYNIQCDGLFPNTPALGENGWAPNPAVCNSNLNNTYPSSMLCTNSGISALSYSEFAGIMSGMLFFGLLADRIGRKGAGILTSSFMVLGIIGMVLYTNSNFNKLFQVWSIFFALFGFGVGGEYPLSASGAAESHLEETEKALQDNISQRQRRMELELAKTARRGETLSIVAAMTGVGAVFGSLVLMALIYFGNQSTSQCSSPARNSMGNETNVLDVIWRAFYLIGFLQVFLLLLYRGVVSEESKTFAKVQARREKRKAEQGNFFLPKILSFYAPRLIGTAGCWFLCDIGFYGIRLFSGPIFQELNPAGGLMVTNAFILLNNVISLIGNYLSAMVIDIKSVGRVKFQMISFLLCAALFLVTGLLLGSDIAPNWAVTFLFFLANFASQFGADVTAYVMAAETYPTELRSTCHGISAFSGKLGALVATVAFSYLSIAWIFFVTAITAVIGFIFTWIFCADLTHVSLSEHDAQLELLLEGQPEKYMGRLNKWEHLSNYERWTKRHGEFDPEWASNLAANYKKSEEHNT